MPTINENQFFTVLIEWEVDPSQQQTLIDAIKARVPVGFQSALEWSLY